MPLAQLPGPGVTPGGPSHPVVYAAVWLMLARPVNYELEATSAVMGSEPTLCVHR
jgi:hypothetical protein